MLEAVIRNIRPDVQTHKKIAFAQKGNKIG